jgi:hypothetical protein
MLILIVKSFGSTNKGMDRVHDKYIVIKRKSGDPFKSTSTHYKLVNFTIIMNKWTVLKLLQNFEFLLSKNCLYTNYNAN